MDSLHHIYQKKRVCGNGADVRLSAEEDGHRTVCREGLGVHTCSRPSALDFFKRSDVADARLQVRVFLGEF